MSTVSLQIPMESLIASINALELKDQQKLLEILEQRVFEAEEAGYEEDAETKAEIEAVQAEYATGEYTTFDDFLSVAEIHL